MAPLPSRRAHRAAPPQTRTIDEELVLTLFARNYMTGRRWLCHFARFCAALGVAIATVAAAWDHIISGAEKLSRLVSHAHF